jgi:hypothetical protein
MIWPPWPKANEKSLAAYVLPWLADHVRLAVKPGGDRFSVIAAIYESLAGEDIRYACEAYNPDLELQQIRDPIDILDGAGDGTCLDLSLLFASVCLGKELIPIVVVMRDHAFVVVSRIRERRQAGDSSRALEDQRGVWVKEGLIRRNNPDVLRQLLDRRDYLAIECTGFARAAAADQKMPEGQKRVDGLLSFADACAAGRAQLEHREFAFAIDPAVLQDIHRIPRYHPGSEGFKSLPTDLRKRLAGILGRHTLFGGRQAELDRLDGFIKGTSGYCLITGPAGSGKSALLANWVDRLRLRGEAVAFHFLSLTDNTAREEDALRTLGQQLLQLRGLRDQLPIPLVDLETFFRESITSPHRQERLVVVLDGIDEADGWSPGKALLERKLAENVYVVLSARETGQDWKKELGLDRPSLIRVDHLSLANLGEQQVGHLLKQAGGNAAKLSADPIFVRELERTSKGDPLYLRLLVDDIQSQRVESAEDLNRLPTGLEGYFDSWYAQMPRGKNVGAIDELLGYLLVALGRLRRVELSSISKKYRGNLRGLLKFPNTIERVRRFVNGEDKNGYALCHPRFQTYLGDRLGTEEAAIYRNRLVKWCRQWKTHRLPYAFTFYAAHLAQALKTEASSEHHDLAERLLALVMDPQFQRGYAEVQGDVLALYGDLQTTLERIAYADGTGLLHVVQAAMGVEAFRRDWLQPAAVFELAEQGRLQAAQERLRVFAAEEEWRRAALLLIAWGGVASRPNEARELKRSVELELPQPLLVLLAERVGAALGDNARPALTLPYWPSQLPAAPQELIARAIVKRLGSATNPELSISGLVSWAGTQSGGTPIYRHDGVSAPQPRNELAGIEMPTYIAEHDSPQLVAFSVANPTVGDLLLKQYISIHAGNPYADYRNRSLWGVLGAVLCHPDNDRARDFMRLLAIGALAPNPVRFTEGLALAALALKARAGQSAAKREFESKVQEARIAAAGVDATLGDAWADAWGNHCRRLAVLAECAARALERFDLAEELLEQARSLPFGFAGYQAPASLFLAEANRVCRPASLQAARLALDAARRSAHNIQEPGFCARITARFNALERRWWKVPIPNLSAQIERFSTDPLAVDFAPFHIVGERYAERSSEDDKLPIGDSIRRAQTPRELARDVFHVALVELTRLNDELEMPDCPLAVGSEVRVPDPKFAPVLAARFAAELVIDSSISETKRNRLLRALIPAAAANSTTLDTTLFRLLLSERPSDEATLDGILKVAPAGWSSASRKYPLH